MARTGRGSGFKSLSVQKIRLGLICLATSIASICAISNK